MDFLQNLFGGDDLVDVLAVCVGIVAMITTVVLTLLGARLVSGIDEIKKRVHDLESELATERSKMYGLRAAAVTLASFLDDTRLAIDVLRRTSEDIIVEAWPGDADRLSAFSEPMAKSLEHLGRLQRFILLLQPSDEEHFKEDVSALCRLFPDSETVDMLLNVSRILPKAEADVAKKASRKLRSDISRRGGVFGLLRA